MIWGLIHGFFIVIERLGFDKIIDRIKIVRNIYTLLVVLIAWVFFRIDTLDGAIGFLKAMFVGTNSTNHYTFDMFLSTEIIIILFFSLIMAINGFNNVFQLLRKKLNIMPNSNLYQTIEFLKFTMLLILFVYCIMNVASGSYNPFIYFRF